ncbi:hypothetical protein B0H14DRAFT_2623619 [Mycena olivaceomarginata]|nr:hypothetical protein B0H14DRAFT_2623619 [Mycena olivaceomarginata]
MKHIKTLEGWDEKTRGMGKSEFNLVQDIRLLLHVPHILRSVQVDHRILMKHIKPSRDGTRKLAGWEKEPRNLLKETHRGSAAPGNRHLYTTLANNAASPHFMETFQAPHIVFGDVGRRERGTTPTLKRHTPALEEIGGLRPVLHNGHSVLHNYVDIWNSSCKDKSGGTNTPSDIDDDGILRKTRRGCRDAPDKTALGGSADGRFNCGFDPVLKPDFLNSSLSTNI